MTVGVFWLKINGGIKWIGVTCQTREVAMNFLWGLLRIANE